MSAVYPQFNHAPIDTAKMQRGEEFQVEPIKNPLFDNIQMAPLRFKTQAPTSSTYDFLSTKNNLPTIIDAEKVIHKLESGLAIAENIKTYAAYMNVQGKQHLTQATISIDNTFVALQTTDEQVATVFRPTDEYKKMNKVNQLLQESNGDFGAFIKKLNFEFGDKVSVEYFNENEGPNYAQTHQLLNGTTFSDYISTQTEQMHKTLSVLETSAMQLAYKGGESSPSSIKVTNEELAKMLNTYEKIAEIR